MQHGCLDREEAEAHLRELVDLGHLKCASSDVASAIGARAGLLPAVSCSSKRLQAWTPTTLSAFERKAWTPGRAPPPRPPACRQRSGGQRACAQGAKVPAQHRGLTQGCPRSPAQGKRKRGEEGDSPVRRPRTQAAGKAGSQAGTPQARRKPAAKPKAPAKPPSQKKAAAKRPSSGLPQLQHMCPASSSQVGALMSGCWRLPSSYQSWLKLSWPNCCLSLPSWLPASPPGHAKDCALDAQRRPRAAQRSPTARASRTHPWPSGLRSPLLPSPQSLRATR